MGYAALGLAVAAAVGFIIVEATCLTRFEVRRVDGRRLVFLSTGAALGLLMLSRFVRSCFFHF